MLKLRHGSFGSPVLTIFYILWKEKLMLILIQCITTNEFHVWKTWKRCWRHWLRCESVWLSERAPKTVRIFRHQFGSSLMRCNRICVVPYGMKQNTDIFIKLPFLLKKRPTKEWDSNSISQPTLLCKSTFNPTARKVTSICNIFASKRGWFHPMPKANLASPCKYI